jgi:hypothetical protein
VQEVRDIGVEHLASNMAWRALAKNLMSGVEENAASLPGWTS